MKLIKAPKGSFEEKEFGLISSIKISSVDIEEDFPRTFRPDTQLFVFFADDVDYTGPNEIMLAMCFKDFESWREFPLDRCLYLEAYPDQWAYPNGFCSKEDVDETDIGEFILRTYLSSVCLEYDPDGYAKFYLFYSIKDGDFSVNISMSELEDYFL